AQADDIRAQMNSALFDENYLFQHYQLNAFAFDKDNQPLLLGQTQGYAWVVEENWNQGQALPNAPQIRYRTGKDGQFRYMMAISTRRMGDAAQPARVFCFLEHKYPKPTRVYARMFYSTPYKNLEGLAHYDFAVQKNGQFLVEQGRADLLQLAAKVQKGETREVESPAQNRVDAIFKSADGATSTAVGRPTGGWFKPLYLFSLLFTAASLLLALLAFANNYFHFLPTEYRFSFTTQGSLAKRIHYSNLSIVALAFLVIGFITYRHFSRTAANVEQNYADYRTSAALTGLKTRLVDASLPADSLRSALPATLATLAGSLTMDANLYSPSGSLVYTTQEDLGKIGVLPPKMSPSALFALRNDGQAEAVETEKIGGLPFFTKYLPLRDGQNQLRGFLGVPYNLAQRTVGVEVSDFIGLLASVYVFLLLIAFGVTFLLARSITRPVTMIAEKIRELQLQDKNAPLEYKGDAQDELSDLIGEYNRMVDKLEASKVQMVRLEREGAWREMARQVAHDIKNPLTTMKLSMQQLERVSNNPEQAAAYLRKAITRLIEQIDSLAQIASEFSMFANIEIRQKDPVKLNEMVESVFDLFSEQRSVDMKLLPSTERFTILGDKNHLIRVFNNLIINAIQAIPSDREGKIRVSVSRRDQMAVVKISDNGGGIPPEIRARVFEPNFTTKTSGSGLGLAICRKIIEGHDGDIRFETRDNEGTDFFVELPIAAFEPIEKRALAESE
ncbi:MAG: HAMP domain-containing sensor histidine kinase, partial [Saprospiraceae bacterium]